MLPRHAEFGKAGGRSGRSVGDSTRFPDFLRRLFDVRQMDFEATFDQMLTLLSFDPDRVHKTFFYRKQTKNQWARDDPAFLVVQAVFVAIAALAYAIALRHASVFGYIWAVFYCLVVDWLLVGMAIASTCSYLANKYLRQYNSHAVEQEVEWLYAFDIHANAFFCSFLVTYVLQYLLLPLLLGRSFISCILSNSLYAVASAWYSYITYLGYTALPFLGNTQRFLWYPTIGIALLWALSLVMLIFGLHINLTRVIMAWHYQ